MFDLNLSELINSILTDLLPSVADLIQLVVLFWAAYQVIGLLRRLLGYRSEQVKDQDVS